MEIDQLHQINDLASDTLLDLSRRLEASTTDEQRVYRECELDEAWRLVDDGQTATEPLRQAIMRAHDIVGIDGDGAAAAAVLRAALS